MVLKSPGCFSWQSDFAEGGLHINMVQYEKHLMFIKGIKTFFKQWQCGACRHCFKQPCNLDKHVKICNGDKVKNIWSGGM